MNPTLAPNITSNKEQDPLINQMRTALRGIGLRQITFRDSIRVFGAKLQTEKWWLTGQILSIVLVLLFGPLTSAPISWSQKFTYSLILFSGTVMLTLAAYFPWSTVFQRHNYLVSPGDASDMVVYHFRRSAIQYLLSYGFYVKDPETKASRLARTTVSPLKSISNENPSWQIRCSKPMIVKMSLRAPAVAYGGFTHDPASTWRISRPYAFRMLPFFGGAALTLGFAAVLSFIISIRDSPGLALLGITFAIPFICFGALAMYTSRLERWVWAAAGPSPKGSVLYLTGTKELREYAVVALAVLSLLILGVIFAAIASNLEEPIPVGESFRTTVLSITNAALILATLGSVGKILGSGKSSVTAAALEASERPQPLRIPDSTSDDPREGQCGQSGYPVA